MSHIVQIHTQVRDFAAVAAACNRLGLPPPTRRCVQLFSEAAEGLAVELPGWHYPVVCDLATGRLKLDNHGGAWGEQKELDRFLQMYAVEKAKLEGRRQGHSVIEQPLSDGSIKVTIQMAGGTA
jgi:hypothetical protein